MGKYASALGYSYRVLEVDAESGITTICAMYPLYSTAESEVAAVVSLRAYILELIARDKKKREDDLSAIALLTPAAEKSTVAPEAAKGEVGDGAVCRRPDGRGGR